MRERIELIMSSRGMSSSQFAQEIGVPTSSISHIISGRNNPSLDLVTKIINRFSDIDIEWLILGKGSMIGKIQANDKVERNIEISEPLKEENKDFSNDLFSDIKEGIREKIEVKNEAEISPKKEIEPEVRKTEPEIKEEEEKRPKEYIIDEKKISKVIIFYSNNTYEELIKN